MKRKMVATLLAAGALVTLMAGPAAAHCGHINARPLICGP